jgi:hypothetical protein
MSEPYEMLIEKFLKIFGIFVVIVGTIGMMIFAPIILVSLTDKPWGWWTYAFFIPLGITILIVVINVVDWDELWEFDDIKDAFEERREEKERQRELAKEKRKEINI